MTGGCVVKGVVSGAIQGIKNCLAAGGTVNTPWGQRQVHWGMLTAVRDSNGSEINQLLGNGLPLWKIGWSHNLQFKRINFYVLLDKTFGNKIVQHGPPLVVGRLHDLGCAAERQVGPEREADRLLLALGGAGGRDGRRRLLRRLGPNNISYEDGGYREDPRAVIVVQRRRDQARHTATGASPRSAETCTRGRSTRVGTRMPALPAGSGQLASGALVSRRLPRAIPQIRNFTLTLSSKF